MTTKSNSSNNSSGSDIHFSALCNAIEHEKLEKARAILETHPSLQLDQTNNDGFTPLDLAFMTGNLDILRLLMNHKCEGKSEFEVIFIFTLTKTFLELFCVKSGRLWNVTDDICLLAHTGLCEKIPMQLNIEQNCFLFLMLKLEIQPTAFILPSEI